MGGCELLSIQNVKKILGSINCLLDWGEVLEDTNENRGFIDGAV